MNYREMFLEDYFDDTNDFGMEDYDDFEQAYMEGYNDMMDYILETKQLPMADTDNGETKEKRSHKFVNGLGKIGKGAIGIGTEGKVRKGVQIGSTAVGAAGVGTGIAGAVQYKKFKAQAPDLYDEYKNNGGTLDYGTWFKQQTKKYKAMMAAGAAGVVGSAAGHTLSRIKKKNESFDLFDYDYFDEDYDDLYNEYEEDYNDDDVYNEAFSEFMIECYDDEELNELEGLAEMYDEFLNEELTGGKLEKANKKLIQTGARGDVVANRDANELNLVSIGNKHNINKLGIKNKMKSDRLNAASDYVSSALKTKQSRELEKQKIKDELAKSLINSNTATKKQKMAMKAELQKAALNYSKRNLNSVQAAKMAAAKNSADTAINSLKSMKGVDPKNRKAYESYIKKCIAAGIKPKSYSTFKNSVFFGR